MTLTQTYISKDGKRLPSETKYSQADPWRAKVNLFKDTIQLYHYQGLLAECLM